MSKRIYIPVNPEECLKHPIAYNVRMMINRNNITIKNVYDYISHIHPDKTPKDWKRITDVMIYGIKHYNNITASTIEDWCIICGEEFQFYPSSQ